MLMPLPREHRLLADIGARHAHLVIQREAGRLFIDVFPKDSLP